MVNNIHKVPYHAPIKCNFPKGFRIFLNMEAHIIGQKKIFKDERDEKTAICDRNTPTIKLLSSADFDYR